MLEKYYDRARDLPNDNSKYLDLDKDDMAKWHQVYYPQLSKCEIIKDASYFNNPVSDDTLGIGVDGRFCKFEYVQFLYRAYRYTSEHAFRVFDSSGGFHTPPLGAKQGVWNPDCNHLWNTTYPVACRGVVDFSKNEKTVNLKQCIDMLEKYTARFENKGTYDGATVTPEEHEVALWKSTYYPFFVKFNLFPDGEFFGDVKANPNLGIGADCEFYGKELFHFLYRCYKFMHSFF
jgi:hypothetical protein